MGSVLFEMLQGVWFLENAIRRILSIDKEAEAYKQNSLPILKSMKDRFEEELKQKKADFEAQLEKDKKRLRSETLQKARDEADVILGNRDRILWDMTNRYMEIEPGLTEEIFRELVEKMVDSSGSSS